MPTAKTLIGYLIDFFEEKEQSQIAALFLRQMQYELGQRLAHLCKTLY